MISVEEARERLIDGAALLGSERVPLDRSAGRVLAEDVVASRDQPPAPVSAMDGYAVRNKDSHVGSRLTVIGEAPAGAPFARNLGHGEAVRIATGGVVPA
ncbi:MAG: molybdopterin molybdenumtransferase MoeA, partial [Sphingomonadales bacterium]|nr:molybdopterin molybdenumtransferase MoeA [Sphingomonadales bacterium]